MIGIVSVALRRPYTFIVLALLIMIFGGLAAVSTPTDIFPNINIPVVSVVWTLQRAAARRHVRSRGVLFRAVGHHAGQ